MQVTHAAIANRVSSKKQRSISEQDTENTERCEREHWEIYDRGESEKISKRVNRTVRSQAAQGKPHGRIPFGYRREYNFVADPDTGRQVRIVHQLPDEVKGPAVDDMANRVFAGDSLSSIAADMQERFGGNWNHRKVREMLLNPANAGLRVFQGEVVGKAVWEPVLVGGDDETPEQKFERLKMKLEDPNRRTTTGSAVKHLLAGIVVCGQGGDLGWSAAITAEQFAQLTCKSPCYVGKGKTYPAYICHEDYHVSARKVFVEDLVVDVVLERLSRKDAAAVFAKPANKDAAKARKEAELLQERLKGFYRQAARGKISDVGIAEIEAELLPEIEKLESAARPVPRSPLVGKLIAAGDVRKAWHDLLLPQQREVIRTIVSPVLIPVGKKMTGDGSRIKFYWHTS